MKKFFTYVLLVLVINYANPESLSETPITFDECLIERMRQEQLYIERLIKLEKEVVALLRLEELEDSEFTIDNLIEYIKLSDADNSDIVIKQSIIESGWFTSNLSTNYNNYFGMHLARTRPTTATGYIIADGGAKVSTYDHWTCSVKDYYLWRDYWDSKGRMCDDYYDFLHNVGYSETGSYVRTLKSINLSKQLDKLNC